MRNITIDGFKRISKKAARHLFANDYRAGKELSSVYIIKRGYRINNPWQPQYRLETHCKQETLIMFEPLVMAFEYYNGVADFYFHL